MGTTGGRGSQNHISAVVPRMVVGHKQLKWKMMIGTTGGRGDLQNHITAVAPEMVVGY